MKLSLGVTIILSTNFLLITKYCRVLKKLHKNISNTFLPLFDFSKQK